MWRFKPSKYKNAVPKVPKKGEDWITEIAVGNLPSFGNHINSSAALVAFNIEQGGQGNLGIVPINEFGRKHGKLPLLRAHTGFVTDFEFCPYDDYILTTASEDCHVKLWRFSDESPTAPSNSIFDISLSHRVEAVKFHPQADCILSVAESNYLHLFDVNTSQPIYSSSEHTSLIHSISWRHSGDILGSCGQDKKLGIWDPRDPSKSQVVSSHYSDRDSKIVWLGDTDQLITTGLGNERQREVFLRDVRNLTEPVAIYSGDTSLKAYIPLFDQDTNMLFLLAQADHGIVFCEIVECAPYLQETSKHISDVQVLGGTLVPKRALRLMDAEVNRLLLLGKDCVVPVSYQVPRKSYRNFHDDLFPETYAPEPSLTSPQWQTKEISQVKKISLNPNKAIVKSNHILGSGSEKLSLDTSNNNSVVSNVSGNESLNQELSEENLPEVFVKPIVAKKPMNLVSAQNNLNAQSIQNENQRDVKEPLFAPTKSPVTRKRAAQSFGIRSSKFRHLNGSIFPKETHLTDLTTLTKTLPGESNCFDANEKRVAVAIGTGGTFLAVLEFSKPGRVPAVSDMPGIVSGSSIMDFRWDPFDDSRLAVACDNGILQLWSIPENFSEKLVEPTCVLRGHSERLTSIKFHPCAQDVIASASSDLSICIWDMSLQHMKYRLIGHTDQILCMAWSSDGTFLSSVSKDQKVRIFNPRNSTEVIKEGPGPKGLRGARILWVLHNTFLAVSGFSKVSERQVYLYDCNDVSQPLEDISLDVSPATLVPYYDEDSSTLFLSGKGDATIFAYEICSNSPHFYPLSHYKCPSPHQALSFLPKSACDVRKAEFACAVRLTASTIERISFAVPRLRMEYFQDDLFPPAVKTWEPLMSSSEWFAGVTKPLERIDLKPSDMIPLSEAPASEKAEPKSAETPVGIIYEGDVNMESSLAFLMHSKEREEQLVQSMMSQCQLQTSELPQEEFEGVDPSEWDE